MPWRWSSDLAAAIVIILGALASSALTQWARTSVDLGQACECECVRPGIGVVY